MLNYANELNCESYKMCIFKLIHLGDKSKFGYERNAHNDKQVNWVIEELILVIISC